MGLVKKAAVNKAGQTIGAEWRFDTANGPVYVFQPEGYSGGGTVVYVHGFYDNVDAAWKKQRLPEQFLASRQDAIFIAPEAPIGSGQSPKWKSLAQLLDTVEINTGLRLGDPVVAIAHSGGYSTVAQWLGDSRLVSITLLDALYGYTNAYRDWANKTGHTLNLVTLSSGTPRINADKIASGLAKLAKRSGVPRSYDDFTSLEKSAKTLYIITSAGHMQLVEGLPGVPVESWIIPVLLRRTPLTFNMNIGLLLAGGLLLLLAVTA